MPRLPVLLAVSAACVLVACGGGDDAEPAPPVELPPAGGSRWAAIEHDADADGAVDSVTDFVYDERGLRTAEITRSLRSGDPVRTVRWRHDPIGRVVRVESWSAGLGERLTDVRYDAAGRLAATVQSYPGGESVTRYVWSGERIFGIRLGDSPRLDVVEYGNDGRVARVVHRDGEQVDTYRWRDDGQLLESRVSVAAGNLVIVALGYDAQGRHVRTRVTDDGIDENVRRHVHDAAGRTVRIEIDDWPDGADDADFVADSIHRIRWEDGPCQPVHLPEPPPTFDRDLTGEASSERVSPGCAD